MGEHMACGSRQSRPLHQKVQAQQADWMALCLLQGALLRFCVFKGSETL